MAEKLPWFPFYGYLFFDDEAVKLMDDAGVGRYLRLLWIAGSGASSRLTEMQFHDYLARPHLP